MTTQKSSHLQRPISDSLRLFKRHVIPSVLIVLIGRYFPMPMDLIHWSGSNLGRPWHDLVDLSSALISGLILFWSAAARTYLFVEDKPFTKSSVSRVLINSGRGILPFLCFLFLQWVCLSFPVNLILTFAKNHGISANSSPITLGGFVFAFLGTASLIFIWTAVGKVNAVDPDGNFFLPKPIPSINTVVKFIFPGVLAVLLSVAVLFGEDWVRGGEMVKRYLNLNPPIDILSRWAVSAVIVVVISFLPAIEVSVYQAVISKRR